MEFTVKKSNLQKELGFVQGVIERKNTIPALQNIAIKSEGMDAIKIIATDLDVSIRCQCEADVKKPGTMLIHARKLFDIVRNLPDAEIQIKKDEQSWAELKCERSKYRIVGQPEEAFPSVPEPKATKLSFPAEGLRYLIEHTIYAITQEENQRFALNGAQFVIGKSSARMIATDGHRLAYVEQKDFELGQTEDFKVLVPRKTLNELLKMLTDLGEQSAKGKDDKNKEDKEQKQPELVMFDKDENHLFFNVGNRVLISRTLSGQFPNYELVMPKEIKLSMAFNTGDFSSAIKRAALMADEKSKGVKLHISNNIVEITSQSTEVGKAEESVLTSYDGPEINVGFNSNYLLDFLHSVGTEEMYLEFKDVNSQAQLRPKHTANYDYKYVVMPMRI
ncbi:MAG: DNA polymerase III subunit beta [Acidobacteria bacterium]|nr:DNA polymerase III subunit beta [Acidobacteriota bacterium]